MKTFWSRTISYPPILIRILARHPGGPPLTDEEISERSGLSIARVSAIAESTTWDGITIPESRAYQQACGIDLCSYRDMNRVGVYLRSRPNFDHLKRTPIWKTHWKPLIQKWRRSFSATASS